MLLVLCGNHIWWKGLNTAACSITQLLDSFQTVLTQPHQVACSYLSALRYHW